MLPVLPFGLTPAFAAFPGSPSLRLETFVSVLRDLLDSLRGQGFRRFLLVNGHGGNLPGGALAREWTTDHPDAQAIFHSWWSSPRVQGAARKIDPVPSHANWFENFPWTRLEGRAPDGGKPPLDQAAYLAAGPAEVRDLLGDGVFGGTYTLPDEQVRGSWRVGVEGSRALESGWRSRRRLRRLFRPSGLCPLGRRTDRSTRQSAGEADLDNPVACQWSGSWRLRGRRRSAPRR